MIIGILRISFRGGFKREGGGSKYFKVHNRYRKVKYKYKKIVIPLYIYKNIDKSKQNSL